MPHQCVRCGRLYPDGSSELLQGCSCGGRFFFYMRSKDIERAKELTTDLTQEEKEKIEKDVMDIVGETLDETQPVILDIESIRVLKPGQYEIDLVDLFKGEPLVYKLEDGKYVIDLLGTFELLKKKKEENS
ncbi:MAG: Zn-ribbon containing protein [Candidatus Nanoarchaeia archaeon]